MTISQPPEEKKEDKPFDAGDASAVARRRKKGEARESMRLSALKSLMSSPGGRLWIWDLLAKCGVYATSTKDGFEPHRITFNEGQRNVGLQIFAELHRHCAGDYAKMVDEARGLEESQ